jgi:hypothetical protein
MSELTAKQKAFIEELPKQQWNGTKAAVAAGYAKNSAAVMAHRLLKNPKIAAELDERTAEIAEKNDVEVGEIVAALRTIAFGGRATNADRLRALDLLGRYKMMFADRHVIETGERQRELNEAEQGEAKRLAELMLRLPAPHPLHIVGDIVDCVTQTAPTNTETSEKQDANDGEIPALP